MVLPEALLLLAGSTNPADDGGFKISEGGGDGWFAFCAEGRRGYAGPSGGSCSESEDEWAAVLMAEPAVENRSRRRELYSDGDAPEEKGGAGMPVNSCTIARKLDVSVVSTVVGARLEARVRFLDEPRGGIGLI